MFDKVLYVTFWHMAYELISSTSTSICDFLMLTSTGVKV